MEFVDHTRRIQFPSPERANEWGLVAQGGNLSPGVVLSAYEQGIFPWYDEPPILWFSPDPRFVLPLTQFHVGTRLARTVRAARPELTITFDHQFDAVIHGCRTASRSSSHGTWITGEMEASYRTLHGLGYTHSVEVFRDGALVGGLYGLSLGGIFAGESMFSLQRDASKFALIALAGFMDSLGVAYIDAQSYTDYLASFGAQEMPRAEFLDRLEGWKRKTVIPTDWRDVDGDAMLSRGLALGR